MASRLRGAGWQVGAGGQAAEQAQVAACIGGNGGVLVVQDMIGLIGLVAGLLGLAVLVHGGERGGGESDASVAPGRDEEQASAQALDGKGGGQVSEEAVAAAVKAGVQAGVEAVLAELEARGSRPLPQLRPLPQARGVAR